MRTSKIAASTKMYRQTASRLATSTPHFQQHANVSLLIRATDMISKYVFYLQIIFFSNYKNKIGISNRKQEVNNPGPALNQRVYPG